MADLSKIAAQEAGELVEFLTQRHLQEWNAREEKEQALTTAVIERTQWLRALTMGEMKLEYVQVLEDGQLRYNDPAGQTTTIEPPAEPSPVETCVQPPEEPPAPEPEEEQSEANNGKRSAKELASAS